MTRKYNSFWQVITTVNTTIEQKYELLERLADGIIFEANKSLVKRLLAEQRKEIIEKIIKIPPMWETDLIKQDTSNTNK